MTSGTGISVLDRVPHLLLPRTQKVHRGGTVTSITAGTGLSGGTITTSGTISLTGQLALALTTTSVRVDAQGGWRSPSGRELLL